MKTEKELSVFVLGLRGFPNVQGGIETHAENLYPLISDTGVSVTCAVRKPYHDPKIRVWKGVKLLRIWAPKAKSFEAIVHSVLSVFRAALMRPDIVHIHAIGPSLVTPLARLAGLRVVVTHHGPDYDREKWSWTAKKILKLGEWIGVRFSNRRIVISSVISSMVLNQYGVDCDIVPNGVPIPDLNSDVAILSKFGLEPGRYIALVSRFVPEKRHIDLINAFEKSGLSDWKLALVGDADHADDYVESLKEKAAQNPNVVLTGFQSGDDLNALFQFAGMFVLPSSHEGLPISLLEALSFGLPCLASSIPANLSVGMDNNFYFALGDIEGMAAKIYATAQKDWGPKEREKIREWVAETYNWSRIADQTVAVYHDAIR